MDTCTIEVGLLRKKPCGEKAVTKCANCEQPLCVKHAVPQMSAGKKTMLCAECAKAWKETEKTLSTRAAAPAAAKKPAEAPKPAPVPPKPAPVAAKPAPARAPAPAAKPVAGKPELSIEHSGSMEFKPAAAAPKPEDSGLDKKPELKIDESGPLEFTPSKKPDEKK